MIKVKLTNYKLPISGYYNGIDYFEFYKNITEMKQWCRDTFGKGYNKHTKSWQWKSATMWVETYSGAIDHFHPVFYFTSEIHASWFLMRWG